MSQQGRSAGEFHRVAHLLDQELRHSLSNAKDLVRVPVPEGFLRTVTLEGAAADPTSLLIGNKTTTGR